MTKPPPPTPLPGWYRDPSGGPGVRYWDGQDWTIVAPPGTPPPPSPATGSSSNPPPQRGTAGIETGSTTAQPINSDRRAGIAVIVMVAVAVVGIGLAAAFARDTEPPPDEDAYVAALFTSPFDVLLPKQPFIDEGYAACELLREGRTEGEAANTLWIRDTSTGGVPEKVKERLLEQTVAAHKYLCPGA
jgi:hypothetical protein